MMLTPRYYFSGEFKDYENIFKYKAFKLEQFNKDTYLSGPQNDLNNIYYVIDGTIRTSLIHESGHEKTFAFHGPGTIVPHYYPGKFKLEYSILLCAVTDVEVMTFDKEYFAQILKEHTDLYDILLDVSVKLINLLMYDIGNQLYNDSLMKVSNFLYSYLKIGKSKNNMIDMSHDEIAAIVGLNRVSVTKSLKILGDKNTIETFRNKIRIIDEEKLLAFCSNELYTLT